MGILDKVMFWKKKDEFAGLGPGELPGEMGGPELGLSKTGLPEEAMHPGAAPGAAPGMPTLEPAGPPEAPQALGGLPPQAAPQPQVVHPEAVGKAEVEIISVKIDNLKTTIEVVNQRLERIEKMLEEQSKKKAGW